MRPYYKVIKPDDIYIADEDQHLDWGCRNHPTEKELLESLKNSQTYITEYEKTGDINTALDLNPNDDFETIKEKRKEQEVILNYKNILMNPKTCLRVKRIGLIKKKYMRTEDGRHRLYIAKKYNRRIHRFTIGYSYCIFQLIKSHILPSLKIIE
jgi:hypothetical protein